MQSEIRKECACVFFAPLRVGVDYDSAPACIGHHHALTIDHTRLSSRTTAKLASLPAVLGHHPPGSAPSIHSTEAMVMCNTVLENIAIRMLPPIVPAADATKAATTVSRTAKTASLARCVLG